DVLRLLSGESVEVLVDGQPVEVFAEEAEVESVPREGYSVVEEPGLMVGVSTEITEELGREGLARDIVRRIQALRKEANFDIDDMIETYYVGDPEVEDVFEAEGEYISTETLSKVLQRGEPPREAHAGEFDIDGLKMKLGLVRVNR
ncbi:MAG: DUF5915 domain-containing protein, partial [Candidatus Bathyarchaeota archaeon]|nr:DUF5915 domain-containing protein [Candidatus Bathyarchaeota archaeon]